MLTAAAESGVGRRRLGAVAGAAAGRDSAASGSHARRRPAARGRPLGRLLGRWATLHADGRRLAAFVGLNALYFAVELAYGLWTKNVELVSDAFHLCFGCGVLSVSLAATETGRLGATAQYTYGHGRAEVLAGFTNACFLLFMAFSLCVEALHSLIEEHEHGAGPDAVHHDGHHAHFLMVSAACNLAVNLVGVVFFRRYATIVVRYRSGSDFNSHGVFLHVASDSLRSMGAILATILANAGLKGAEALVDVAVAASVTIAVLPLAMAAGRILLQALPGQLHAPAMQRCLREVRELPGVTACDESKLWCMTPGALVGTLTVGVAPGADEAVVLRQIHQLFERSLGVADLTVQIEPRCVQALVIR